MHDYEFCELPPPRDGMMDIPPRKVPRPDDLPVAIGPEHLTGLAEAYARAALWRTDPRGWREDAEGGMWFGDPTPTDEEVMQPIVEAAMRSIGMSVPLRPIIPTITRGRRHHGR